MNRLTLTMLGAAAALTVSTCGAPAADAAQLSMDGGTLVFRGSPGEANHLLATQEDGVMRLSDDDANPIDVGGAPCTREDWQGPGAVTCTPSTLRAELGDGDDVFDVGSLWGVTPVVVDGGPGRDDLDGGDGADVLTGGPGADTLRGLKGDDRVLGGDDGDTVKGGNGRDEIRGEGGDDVLEDAGLDVEPDVIDGGAGRDTLSGIEWSEAGSGRTQRPATLTLDGVADDGRPGEGDQVTGIEVAKLHVPMTMRAGGEAVEFSVFNTASGSTTLVGSPAGDTLTGFDDADTVDGGAGDDTIQGGFGDDTITGGPGRDSINADVSSSWCGIFECRMPYGNDTIDARDGEADSVDCGVGTDTVLADAVDTVAPNCETVKREAAGGGGQQGTGGGGQAPAPGARLTVKRQTLRTVARRGLKLGLANFPAGKLTIEVRLGKRTLATKRTTITAGGDRAVRVRFGRTARKRLTARRTAKLVVTAGETRRTVTLKR